MATERFCRNTISSITSETGQVVIDHAAMAGMFLQDFKLRMGCYHGIHMGFKIAALHKRVNGLEDLSMPFSNDEIELVIRQMPSDKAPGLDGFTGFFFLKICWSLL